MQTHTKTVEVSCKLMHKGKLKVQFTHMLKWVSSHFTILSKVHSSKSEPGLWPLFWSRLLFVSGISFATVHFPHKSFVYICHMIYLLIKLNSVCQLPKQTNSTPALPLLSVAMSHMLQIKGLKRSLFREDPCIASNKCHKNVKLRRI